MISKKIQDSVLYCYVNAVDWNLFQWPSHTDKHSLTHYTTEIIQQIKSSSDGKDSPIKSNQSDNKM